MVDAAVSLEDPFAITVADPESEAEARFLALARDPQGRILVVMYSMAASKRGSSRRGARVAVKGRSTGNEMRKEYDFSNGVRGPAVGLAPGKTRITIRFDDDLLEWFKRRVEAAGGGNYQSLMNAALREHVQRESEPLEATLRRVVREELGNAGKAPDAA